LNSSEVDIGLEFFKGYFLTSFKKCIAATASAIPDAGAVPKDPSDEEDFIRTIKNFKIFIVINL
jgi:hypothetical protein